MATISASDATTRNRHRHQRKEAEKLIREEIQENQKALRENAKGLMDEINGVNDALKSLEAISDGHAGTLSEKEMQFQEGPMRDSAWRTANATGVVSYMDYDEVEKFSNVYKEQDQLQEMERLALNDYLQLTPILLGSGSKVDAARAKEALPYARNAAGHLSGMYYIGRGTLEAYAAALK
jgi:hypothetical protein